MSIRHKRTVLFIGGLIAVVFLALEVAYFGFTAFFTALGVWVVLVGPALVVTPRRGPEDEIWVFGLVREFVHWLRGRLGGGGNRQTPVPSPGPVSTHSPPTAATPEGGVAAPRLGRDHELWIVALFRAAYERLHGKSGRRDTPPAAGASAAPLPDTTPPAGTDTAPAESPGRPVDRPATARHVQLPPALRMVGADAEGTVAESDAGR